MGNSTDPDAAWAEILRALASGDTDAARKLLWPSDAGQQWCATMAPRMESAGDGYGTKNRSLAIFCYEQAKQLFEAEASGATSGGEGYAAMSEMPGSHLGRKIWLLKS